MPRRIAWVAAVFVAAVVSWSAKAQDPGTKVEKVFARIEENKGATLWDDVRELRDAGKDALDAVRQGLTRADANVRIAAGATIYTADARDEGLEALLQVAKDSKQEGAPPSGLPTALVTAASLRPHHRPAVKIPRALMAMAGEPDDELVVHLSGAFSLNEPGCSSGPARTSTSPRAPR
jgi:hypothetical protein